MVRKVSPVFREHNGWALVSQTTNQSVKKWGILVSLDKINTLPPPSSGQSEGASPVEAGPSTEDLD
jgi:hypothetical protein